MIGRQHEVVVARQVLANGASVTSSSPATASASPQVDLIEWHKPGFWSCIKHCFIGYVLGWLTCVLAMAITFMNNTLILAGP